MHISDEELGRMSATGGMTVGSPVLGSIWVGGVTADNSDSIGTLTLVATQHAQTVTFTGASSTFNKV